MPQVHPIQLRLNAGKSSAGDLTLSVQDKTFEYLMTSTAEEIRVSTYLDQDLPHVGENYEELYVNSDCKFQSKVVKIIPGSKTRKVQIPGEMKSGEQIVVLVKRTPL
jgi:hypothetical protein